MPVRSPLLPNHLVVHSTDVDYTRDRLVQFYGITSFDVASKGRGFEICASHLQIGDVGLSYCEYAKDVSLGFGESTFVRQFFNISGSAAYSGGEEGAVAEGGCSKALQSGLPLKLDFSPNYRHLVLRIEQAALQRHLNALLGREIAGELRFHDSVKEHAAMQRLRRAVFQFASDFDGQADSLSPLAAAELSRGLIMRFLMSHNHDHSHLLFRTPPASHASATKKVEEFIEANWDKPIDILQLSDVARVSARTLFRQFKKDRGYSPAEFIRRTRLDHARTMLETPIEDTSVTQVALKCGFQNSGHFAREFRLAFGELPSETLRRALRAG